MIVGSAYDCCWLSRPIRQALCWTPIAAEDPTVAALRSMFTDGKSVMTAVDGDTCPLFVKSLVLLIYKLSALEQYAVHM